MIPIFFFKINGRICRYFFPKIYSPVKKRTARGIILSRIQCPISKSAVKRSCVSGSTSASGSSEIGGGSKKLKKLSFLTCLVIVRTFPLLLCFCFFFTVFTVRFFPGSFQLMVHPLHLKISGPEKHHKKITIVYWYFYIVFEMILTHNVSLVFSN